ncbi:MAG TPA: hypothetical protein HPP97_02690 [Desulfuromonadales bacterium]|nr:hypothetical protein [Desulfuromonadales bacterium]
MAKHPCTHNDRHRQQPPLRSSWRSTTQATIKRGKYADIADRVRDHRLALLARQKNQADEMNEAQKQPASD